MRRLSALGLAAVTLAWVVGCGRDTVPHEVRAGTPCAVCGMAAEDLRFACERRVEGRWRVYDSIECLLREGGESADVYLADYDTMVLHPAATMWIVQGSFETPMGGGLAAFSERARADEVARATAGVVDRLERFARPPLSQVPR
jgi:nitrous oxide reductase accessory protein NosL